MPQTSYDPLKPGLFWLLRPSLGKSQIKIDESASTRHVFFAAGKKEQRSRTGPCPINTKRQKIDTLHSRVFLLH